MAKYLISDLIKTVEERNSDGNITAFYGININKELESEMESATRKNIESINAQLKNQLKNLKAIPHEYVQKKSK